MKKNRKLFTTVVFLVIAAMALSTSAFAAEATVNSYMLNMREGQGTEYTIIDVAYEGNTVNVLQDDGSGWVQVSFNGQTGYMNKLFLTFKETEVPPVTQTYTAPVTTDVSADPYANATVFGTGVNMRSGPSLTSSVVDNISTGTPIRVNGACGAWYEVVYNGKIGYIYGDYVVMNGQSVVYTVTAATVEEPTPVYTEPATMEINAPVETVVSTPVSVTEPAPAAVTPAAPETPAVQTPVSQPAATTYNATSGQAIVNTAMQYIGTPYVWAGTSPEEGFDCSGLVYYVYGQNGYSLNRVAQNMYYNGENVDLNNMQPGDIVLFGSSVYNIWHAGIYVGNGQFIHSPHSGSTVRVESLSDTVGLRLVAARRVVS